MGERKRRRAPRTAEENGPGEVRRCLQSYADRGVFRGFSERAGWRGRTVFRFSWLARRPYDLEYEPDTGTFVFLNALPNVAARTPLARALRTFVAGRSDAALPPHRRIDPDRAEVSAFVRQGEMRLKVVAARGDHAYAANRVVNLMHEVFLYLQSYHPDYLWANYDASQD
ncbi:MAG TPA: hypothetical protein VLA09_05135 [Longimicrobiales bacterium]|nr:hypothetical protein [Longimicrobiales bacterium]